MKKYNTKNTYFMNSVKGSELFIHTYKINRKTFINNT